MVEAILTTAALITGVTIIGGAGVKAFLIARKVVQWVEQVHKVTTQELRPNGGASMKDEVRQMRDDLYEYIEDDTEHRQRTWVVLRTHAADHGPPLPEWVD